MVAAIRSLVPRLLPLALCGVVTSCGDYEVALEEETFVIAGVRASQSYDAGLVWVDLAHPETEHVLVEAQPEQRFGPPVWSSQGDALFVVRKIADESVLLRVPLEGEAEPIVDLGDSHPLQVHLTRSRNGLGLIGVQRLGDAFHLLRVDETGSASTQALNSLALPEGDWKVMAPSPSRLVFFTDAESLDPGASPEQARFVVVTDSQLQVHAEVVREAAESSRCHAAPDGTALVCAIYGDSGDESLWLDDASDWSAPVSLGQGGAGEFSDDSSHFVGASSVRRRAALTESVLDLAEEDGVSWWDSGSTQFSPQGRYFLSGRSDQVLRDLQNGDAHVIGRHTGVGSDVPSRVSWSNDGQWFYSGQCDGPDDPDESICGGRVVSVEAIVAGCVDPDPEDRKPLDGCSVQGALGVSHARVRP